MSVRFMALAFVATSFATVNAQDRSIPTTELARAARQARFQRLARSQWQQFNELERGLGTEGRALAAVAKEALSRNSGARGLRAILEHAMLDIMYDVPGRSGIKEVVINEDVITKREPPLIVYQKEAELA